MPTSRNSGAAGAPRFPDRQPTGTENRQPARLILMAAQGAAVRTGHTSLCNSQEAACLPAHPRPLRAAERQKVWEGRGDGGPGGRGEKLPRLFKNGRVQGAKSDQVRSVLRVREGLIALKQRSNRTFLDSLERVSLSPSPWPPEASPPTRRRRVPGWCPGRWWCPGRR
jgi:hypothetical protein